jgi:hypothetical protein
MSIARGALPLFVSALMTLTAAGESFAGFERRYAGARAIGAAGALGSFGEDAWSFYANPAHAAAISEAGMFYSPSIFGLSEIKSMGIAYRDHILSLDISGAVQSFGYEIYRETVFSINASAPLSEFLFLGANVNLNHLFIKDYGTGLAASLDVGGRSFLSDHFSLSFSATNVSSASVTLSNDRLPQTLTAGVAYISDELNVCTEYFKELGFPSAARVAAEFSPVEVLTFRAASSSGSSSFSAGLTVRLAKFRVDYGVMLHQVLGLTHCVGISISFGGDGETEFESIQKYRQLLRR